MNAKGQPRIVDDVPIKLLDVPDGATVAVRLLGGAAECLWMHFVPTLGRCGRSQPCSLAKDCPHCTARYANVETRFIPALAAVDLLANASGSLGVCRWIVPATGATWEAVKGFEMRGLLVEVARPAAKAKHRYGMRFTPKPFAKAGYELPEPFDVRPALLRAWSMRAWPFTTDDSTGEILPFRKAGAG